MNSFKELDLNPLLMRAIEDLGYEKPTPIQSEALPILLGEPTDFIGLAATGTGKTAAFAVPLLERIDTKKRAVQGLILCPTRELAIQVSGQINLLGKHLGVRSLPIYGGAGYGDQIHGLKSGAMIVVGTPGRVVDHMEKGTLRLENLKTVILDEADEMISMGFKDDLQTILGSVPPGDSNTWLFSATMSRDVRKVADEYLNEPRQIQVNKTEMLPENVEQLYYTTSESNKPEVLCKLIDAADDFYGLIFCQTKALVADLTQYLIERGYRVDCLHGDKDQTARDKSMKAFRDRKVSILVCTDVASRGLDVKDVTHVINYSIPRELDNYVHRIGRTARSGKTGFAMSLVTPSHRMLIGRIEKMTKRRMMEGKIPTRKEIGTRKISKVLEKFQEQEAFSRAVDLMDTSWTEALAGMSREEIAGRFLSLTFPEVFMDREQQESQKPQRVPAVMVSGDRPAKPAAKISAPARISPVAARPSVAARSDAPGVLPRIAPMKVDKISTGMPPREKFSRWKTTKTAGPVIKLGEKAPWKNPRAENRPEKGGWKTKAPFTRGGESGPGKPAKKWDQSSRGSHVKKKPARVSVRDSVKG